MVLVCNSVGGCWVLTSLLLLAVPASPTLHLQHPSAAWHHSPCLPAPPASASTQVVEGGTVFFRESCFRQSGDKARKNNPTHYRWVLVWVLG